jgi:adenylate cyclase
MKLNRRSRMVLVAVLAVVVAGGMTALVPWAAGGPLADFEGWGYDLLVNASRETPRHEVVFVDFDDAAVKELGTYPVPRAKVAEVIERTADRGAEIIALDILLSEPRTPAEDRRLAEALRHAGNVIVGSQRGGAQLPPVKPLPLFCARDEATARGHVSSCADGPALGVGFVDLPVDDDGVIRRSFMLPAKGGDALPFAVLVASNFLQKPPLPCGEAALCFGDARTVPDDAGMQSFLITWNGPVPHVSVSDLLAGKVDPALLKGKIAVIGQSAAAGNDLRITPLFRGSSAAQHARLTPGSEILAAAIETLLHGSARGIVPPRTSALLTFVVVALLFFAAALAPSRYVAVAVVSAMAVVFGAALWMFHAPQLWMRFVTLEIGLLLVVPPAMAYRVAQERWFKREALADRKQLMDLFARYTSREVAEEIWRRRDEVILAGEERPVTILFSDIRNFTAITAGKPPKEVLTWLNQYLDRMSTVITRHGGFLNKFIGDGIMVLYGVPLTAGEQEDACRAVETALDMLDAVEALNAENAGAGERPQLKIGVGIHSGSVVAGNVGSRERLEYSAIGEAVNLASRLESLTKEMKAPIVLSPATAELVRARFQPRPIGKVVVRGFTAEIPVYTVERSPAKRSSATQG